MSLRRDELLVRSAQEREALQLVMPALRKPIDVLDRGVNFTSAVRQSPLKGVASAAIAVVGLVLSLRSVRRFAIPLAVLRFAIQLFNRRRRR